MSTQPDIIEREVARLLKLLEKNCERFNVDDDSAEEVDAVSEGEANSETGKSKEG